MITLNVLNFFARPVFPGGPVLDSVNRVIQGQKQNYRPNEENKIYLNFNEEDLGIKENKYLM